MDKQPIDPIAEVKKLNLDPDQVLISGAGILSAKGIRPTYDLDLIVSQDVFDSFAHNGFEVKSWTKPGMEGKMWLKKEGIEMQLEILSEGRCLGLEELKLEGECINGYWFLSLKQLMKFKREYGRPKDFTDIKLIERYFAGNL